MAEKKFAGFTPSERRKYIRIVETCEISFINSKGETGEGELLDLSLRGLRFISEFYLNSGEKVRIVFILSNGISLDLSGIIRHRQGKPHKWVYGMEFSIRDYRDLKEHIKLNGYIVKMKAEQDRFMKEQFLKKSPWTGKHK